jgi:hypothetical protein
MDARTLMPALMQGDVQRKPKTRAELIAELRAKRQEQSAPPSGADFVLPPADVPRPNAPNLPPGMSLDDLAKGAEAPAREAPRPPSPASPVDMDAVRETNSQPAPKQPLIEAPDGSPVVTSQADLARRYKENPNLPPKPTGKTSFEEAMGPAMEDAVRNEKQKRLKKEIANGRRPFDMTNEEKAERAQAAEDEEAAALAEDMEAAEAEEMAAAEESGAFDEPPPPAEEFPDVPEDMEEEMRAGLNNPVPAPEDDGPPGETPAERENRLLLEKVRREHPAQEQSEASKRRSAKLRRQRLITSWAARTGLSRGDIADLYDEGAASAAEGEDAHGAGIDAIVTSDARHNAEHNDLEQRRANVTRRAQQQDRARRQGIPFGMVMAIDEINNAQDDRSMLQAMINASAVYPQFGAMAQAVANGQIASNELKARLLQSQMQFMTQREIAELQSKTEAEKNKSPVDKANDRAKGAEFSPQGINDVVLTSAELGHDPETARQYLANTYSEPMNAMADSILAGESPDPQELAALKQVLMRYTDGNMPTARDMVAVFGRRSKEDLKELADMFFGEAGVRNLTTFGNMLGAENGEWIADNTWFG